MNCPFCNFKGDSLGKAVLENEYCIFIQDYNSIPEGSGMIIPKEHRETPFDLTYLEWEATNSLLHKAKELIDEQLSPDGYNIGWNIGKIGGQHVFHAHMHVIPRYADELYAGKGIRYWIKQPENKRKNVSSLAKKDDKGNILGVWGVYMLKHKGTRELITKRLKLRRFILSDATSMYKNYATDERVSKFLSWRPYKTIEGVEGYLSDLIEQYTNPNVYHWAMEMNNEIIGSISTISINDKNCNCEVGYCIGYDYWNKGITTEALNAVIKFLFNEVGIHRITAKHDVENPSSGKVLQKCNMKYEGKLRDYYRRHDGTYSDSLVYGILKM